MLKYLAVPQLVLPLCAVPLTLATAAQADAPRVVADIAPVHSLVAQVMGDVGAPDLLIAPGQSPHSYSMRPSDGRMLQKADMVIWVGHGLTPWLEKPLDSLAEDARHLELLEVPGLALLEYEDDHDDHDDHGDKDGHEDHDEDHADHKDGHEDHDEDHADHKDGHEDHDEDHADHKDGHEDHDEDHADHKGGHDEHDEDHAEADGHDDHDHHDHGGVDPHAWLDPVIAVAWLEVIAAELAEIDPDNADTYHANAKAAAADVAAMQAELAEALEPVEDKPFVVFHDAYGYYEQRFHLTNAGTVSRGDAQKPGAARIAELKAQIAHLNVRCGFAEPQYDPALLEAAGEDADLSIGTIDPHGAHLEPGPALYGGMMRSIAQSLVGCLAG